MLLVKHDALPEASQRRVKALEAVNPIVLLSKDRVQQTLGQHQLPVLKFSPHRPPDACLLCLHLPGILG